MKLVIRERGTEARANVRRHGHNCAGEAVVECSNCGGGELGIQFWIAIAGLAIAIFALGMNYRQFRHFLNELRARAEFDVTMKHVGCDDDGVLRTTDGSCVFHAPMWLKNTGKRAAGETVINVIVPRTAVEVRWCGPNGEEMEEGRVVAPTEEVLEDFEGRTHPGQFLSRTLPGLGTKPRSLCHFEFQVELPEPQRYEFPIRVVVLADEIPDEVDAYVKNFCAEAERTVE